MNLQVLTPKGKQSKRAFATPFVVCDKLPLIWMAVSKGKIVKATAIIFWIIAILGLVWHLMTGLNFVVQGDPEFVATMPEPYRNVVESRPLWATAAFGLAAFAGFAGSVMMLLRRSEASLLFFVTAIASLVVALAIILGVGATPVVMGPLFSATLAAGLGLYSRTVIG